MEGSVGMGVVNYGYMQLRPTMLFDWVKCHVSF